MDSRVPMDQLPLEYFVRPSDLKRVPLYYAPASPDVHGNEGDSQTPIYLVPANAVRDPRRVAAGDSFKDLSSNVVNAREGPVFLRSSPGVYEYAPYGGRPLEVEFPARGAGDSDSTYGSSRAVPTVVYEPLQKTGQAQSPPSFTVPVRPSSGESSFLRPRYDGDQMWIPRHIPSEFSRLPTPNVRGWERYAPGSRQVPPYYVPLNSGRPHYGFPNPNQDVEGTTPFLYQPYMVDAHDNVDPRHPSSGRPVQRGRSDMDDGPVRGVRERHPPHTVVPCKDVGELLPYRPDDGYYIVRGPDGFPVVYGGHDGGHKRMDSSAWEVPANQAAVVPVDFPVTDLAKVKAAGDEHHDPPYPDVFYHPKTGRIIVNDPRRTPGNSSAFASPPSRAEFVPIRIGSKPAQSDNHFNEAYRGMEGHDVESRSVVDRTAPSVSGVPISGLPFQYTLPRDDSTRDSQVQGGVEATRLKAPYVSRLIPAHSTSTTPNAGLDGDQGSSVAGPFYRVNPLLGSDKTREVLGDWRADGGDELASSSVSKAAVKDGETVKRSTPLYLRPLAGSEKIKEVFGNGSSDSGEGFVVTRIIPVSSLETDYLPAKSKDSGVPKEVVRNDQVFSTSKNTGMKDSSEKSKNTEFKESLNPKEAVRSTVKTSKPNNDLMANIGKAFWSSRPKEKKAVTEESRKMDKYSKHGDGAVNVQNRNADLLLSVGKAMGSQPSEDGPKRSESLPKVEDNTSSDSEKGDKVKNVDGPASMKPEASVPVKSDATVAVIRGVPVSDTEFRTDDRNSFQEGKVTQVDTKLQDQVPEVAAGQGPVVQEDFHPNFSITQEQERVKDSSIVEPAETSTDSIEAEVSAARSVTSVKRDDKAHAGDALVEEAGSGESSDSKGVSSIDRQDTMSLCVDRAGTKIQARYRGHVVRQADIFKPLRTIKKMQTKLQSLQSQVRTNEDVGNLLANPKERLKITESAMCLLLELDSLQGVHPFVREMRKYVARQIVKFQDRVDAVMKGELGLPSANSSAAEAGLATDTGEIVAAAETHSSVKEEQLDDAVLSSKSHSVVREVVTDADVTSMAGGDGSPLHFVDCQENVRAVDASMENVSEVPRDTEVETNSVAQTTSGSRSQEENSSVACSGDEHVAVSCVSDMAVDKQSVGVGGEGALPPCVEVSSEDHGSADVLLEKCTDDETDSSAPGAAGSTVDAFAGDSVKEEVTISSSANLTLDGVEDKTVAVLSGDELHSVVGGSGCTAPDGIQDSLQNCVSEAGIFQEQDASDRSVAELRSLSVNSSQELEMSHTLESHPDPDSCSLPSNVTEIVLTDDDHTVLEVSVEDEVETSSQERSEAIGVNDNVLSSEFVNIKDNSIEAAKVGETSETKVSELPRCSLSGVEVGADNFVPSVTEEAEVIVRDEKDVALDVEDGLSLVPNETAEVVVAVKDNPDGASDVGEVNHSEKSEHSSEKEVTLYDSSPLASAETEVISGGDEVVLLLGEGKVHGAVSDESSKVALSKEDIDGASKVSEESERTEVSCENRSVVELGALGIPFPPTEGTECISSGDDNVHSHLEVGLHESLPRGLPEMVKEDDCAAAKAAEYIGVELSDMSAEKLQGLDREVGELSVPLPTMGIEGVSRENYDVPSYKQGRVDDVVSSESSDAIVVLDNGDAAAEVLYRNDREGGEHSPEVSPGKELRVHFVPHVVPSPLPGEETSSTNSSESPRDNDLESDVSVDGANSPSPAEGAGVFPFMHRKAVADSEPEVVAKMEPVMDGTATIQAVGKSLKEEDVGSQLYCTLPTDASSFRPTYDEYDGSGGELESQYDAVAISPASEDRDALIKQLTEENRILQHLFREVIRSNSDNKTTIQDMLYRLGKLEQVVKEQDRGKEKRKKSKKAIRH